MEQVPIYALVLCPAEKTNFEPRCMKDMIKILTIVLCTKETVVATKRIML
jgi:hypothetical protein